MKRLPFQSHKLETPGSTPEFRSQVKKFLIAVGIVLVILAGAAGLVLYSLRNLHIC